MPHVRNSNELQVSVSPLGNVVVVTSANLGIPVFVSADQGATWSNSGSFIAPGFNAVVSNDLSTLYLAAGRNLGGLVYKSIATMSATNRSTTEITGSVSGGANDALELQFLGAGQWGLPSAIGYELMVQ